jgi:hypothetical protein
MEKNRFEQPEEQPEFVSVEVDLPDGKRAKVEKRKRDDGSEEIIFTPDVMTLKRIKEIMDKINLQNHTFEEIAQAHGFSEEEIKSFKEEDNE